MEVARGLEAVAGVLRSLIFTPAATPCSERYTNSTAFTLERGGVTLTAADLQSRLGGQDAGVMDSVTIARLRAAA